MVVPAPHACDVLSGENAELEAVVWFDLSLDFTYDARLLVFGGFCQAGLRYYLDSYEVVWKRYLVWVPTG